MFTTIKNMFLQPIFISFVCLTFVFSCIEFTLTQSVKAASASFQFTPKKRSIRGQDLNFKIKIEGKVSNAKVCIRPLGEDGPFAEFDMKAEEGGFYSGTIPLSTDDSFKWEPLEYYFTANEDTTVAQSSHHIISFIEAPIPKQGTGIRTAELTTQQWNKLVYKKPFYKSATFWVGVAAVAGVATALLIKKDPKPKDLQILSFDVNPNSVVLNQDAIITGTCNKNAQWTVELTTPSDCIPTFESNPPGELDYEVIDGKYVFTYTMTDEAMVKEITWSVRFTVAESSSCYRESVLQATCTSSDEVVQSSPIYLSLTR